MFCKNCGAAVTGKYCSCCGTRVRSDYAEFKLMLSRRKRAWINEKYGMSGLQGDNVGHFCWTQAEMKVTRGINESHFNSRAIDPMSMVEEIECAADKLYSAVMVTIGGLNLRWR